MNRQIPLAFPGGSENGINDRRGHWNQRGSPNPLGNASLSMNTMSNARTSAIRNGVELSTFRCLTWPLLSSATSWSARLSPHRAALCAFAMAPDGLTTSPTSMLCHNFCARESKPESQGGSYEANPGETLWLSPIREKGPVSLQSAKSIDKKTR